jgi:hypothetical protein
MHAEAEQSVHDILKSYGRSICDTPRMFETLLRRHGKASPNEVGALVSAVQHNVVKKLLSDDRQDVESLTKILTVQGRQPPLVAKWAVETWQKALSTTGPDRKVREWNAVETPAGMAGASTSIARKALFGLVLVSAMGLVGGAAPGLYLGYGLMHHNPDAQHIVHAAGIKDVSNPQQFMLVYTTLGGLAGLVGAGVGWMFGGHTRMTPGRVAGAMIGALQAGANGAFYGLLNGEGAGTFIGCLILTGVGTYIATLMGVFVVLILLGQLAKVILLT